MPEIVVDLEVKDLRKIQARFRGITKEVNQKIRLQTFRSALNIQRTARNLVPVDTGRLKNSINVRMFGLVGVIYTNVDYSIYVEFGTRPHFPPVQALEGWAERHDISPFALALSIARRGTAPQPYMKPALDMEKDNYLKSINRIIGGLG